MNKKLSGKLSNIYLSEAISCLKTHNTTEKIKDSTAEGQKVRQVEAKC